jgi:hypothetical protein
VYGNPGTRRLWDNLGSFELLDDTAEAAPVAVRERAKVNGQSIGTSPVSLIGRLAVTEEGLALVRRLGENQPELVADDGVLTSSALPARRLRIPGLRPRVVRSRNGGFGQKSTATPSCRDITSVTASPCMAWRRKVSCYG